MEKTCNVCECVEYCLENGYCVGAAIKKKYDANDWEDENEKGIADISPLKEPEQKPDISVTKELFEAIIKG